MCLRRNILRIAATVSAGFLPALFEWGMGETRRQVLLEDSAIGILSSIAIAVPCWIIFPRVAGRILRLPFAFKWVSLISLITAIAALGSLAALSAGTALHIIPARLFWHTYFNSARIAIFITLGFALSVTFHEVLLGKLNKATEDLKAKDLAEERLRQIATEARLSSLESRVHPHFLFNTLNSISALIRESPAEAERMVERLSALLRFSLDSGGARLVPLSQEFGIVRTYLEIEKVRFGDRLRYKIEADPALDSLEVPPLSVQTLVENSVKFAVSPRREGAEITVRAVMREGKPAIDVLDDGPGFSIADLKAGHGLDLLQSRLAAQFGSGSALEIGRDPNLTRVTVLI
jgi:sensor histidine kinase YesM